MSQICLAIFLEKMMRLLRINLLSTLFACLFSITAFAETSTFEAVSDNTLIEDLTGSRSNGSADAIYVGRTQRDGLRRGLIRFNVSAIPTNSIIQSASLKLHLFRSRPENSDLSIHRCLNSWGEGASNYFGGLGGQALAGDATWLHRFFGSSQLWSSVGGDYLTQASATEIIGPTQGVTHTITSAGLATDVADWLAQPSTNYGWVLAADADASAKAYASRENTTTTLRPQLVVTWSPPVVSNNDSVDVPIPLWALVMFGAAVFFNVNRYRH